MSDLIKQAHRKTTPERERLDMKGNIQVGIFT